MSIQELGYTVVAHWNIELLVFPSKSFNLLAQPTSTQYMCRLGLHERQPYDDRLSRKAWTERLWIRGTRGYATLQIPGKPWVVSETSVGHEMSILESGVVVLKSVLIPQGHPRLWGEQWLPVHHRFFFHRKCQQWTSNQQWLWLWIKRRNTEAWGFVNHDTAHLFPLMTSHHKRPDTPHFARHGSRPQS